MMKQISICPTCGEETVQKVRQNLEFPKLGLVPDVPHEKCETCGEILLGPESYNVIEKYEKQTVSLEM